MAWAPCICRTILSRCVPGASLTTTRRTSWTTTARDRLLGTMAPVMGGGQTLVQAAVGVVVLSCDGKPPHDVYGTVTATTTLPASGEPPLRYSLFEKVKGGPVRVPEGTAIPLQREHVQAPLCSQLEVSAHLRNLDSAYYYHGGSDEIADGSAAFTPSLDGTDGAVIQGKHGKVRVDVTWSSI